jgi:uncharacterized membrane protein
MMTLALTPETRAQVAHATAASAQRQGFVDVFRGLLIAHMALDHASLMFNAGRGGEELAAAAPQLPADIFQFLTRFTGVPVAPAFCFMAGFMIALTSIRREARGVSRGDITRRLVVRGLVLIAVDAVIMGLPRALMGFYSFMVLSSIGVAIIIVALLRDLPTKIILPAALAVLLLHPLIDVSALPLPLRAVLYEPVRDGVATLDLWSFAKYPPDLPFLTWSFAATFLSLAALRLMTRGGTPAVLRPFEVFGRVPFFFYVVHFYVLGVAAAAVQTKLGLGETYAVWLLLLVAMAWPCAWYYRKKLDRPNVVTRYF